jgi:hypothetical protein
VARAIVIEYGAASSDTIWGLHLSNKSTPAGNPIHHAPGDRRLSALRLMKRSRQPSSGIESPVESGELVAEEDGPPSESRSQRGAAEQNEGATDAAARGQEESMPPPPEPR